VVVWILDDPSSWAVVGAAATSSFRGGICEFFFTAALDFAMAKLLTATIVLLALGLARAEDISSMKGFLREEDQRLLRSSGSAVDGDAADSLLERCH
jgi:hypothetical protein